MKSEEQGAILSAKGPGISELKVARQACTGTEATGEHKPGLLTPSECGL